MSATVEPVQVRAAHGGGWLYGPWTDLLLGCGLFYLLASPLLFAITRSTATTSWPSGTALWFAFLINGPHYGATILRVYEGREERRKYAVFAVYLTLALAIAFVAASRSLWLASVLITAYLTWSPWHFSGQNYGLAVMFLRRRGVDVDPLTKRLIYASFVLSAVLAMLAIHGGYEQFVFAPATLHVPNTPSVLALRLPSGLAGPLFAGVLAIYLGCLAVSGWRLCRRAALRDLAPAFLLVLTQSLWFTVPALRTDAVQSQLVFSAIWISAWHSLQYLWVTAYYAKSSGRQDSTRRFFLKAAAAGAGVTVLPGLIMSPRWFGSVAWDAGLAVTLFSVVNLHHFILDGAIWKLRDGRVARVLLRAPDPRETAVSTLAPRHRPWLRGLVWTIAALSLLVPLSEIVARVEIGRGGRSDEIQLWTRLLEWVGRETTEDHYWIGTRYARAGYHEEAIAQYLRSNELFPTGRAWFALANEYRTLGRWELARAAYESAITINPEIAAFHLGRAEALLARSADGSDDATRSEAMASLEQALELRPGYAKAALELAQIYERTGQKQQAIDTLEGALAAHDASGEQELRGALAKLRP